MKPSRTVRKFPDGSQIITIVLPGDPPGKPRQTRRDKWKQRPCVMRYRAWADALRAVTGRLPKRFPERVDIMAHFGLPPSWSAKRKAAMAGKAHRSKPDCDNVSKSTFDALWKRDDSGIAWESTRKAWAGEGGDGSITVAIHYNPEESSSEVAP